MIGLPTSFFEKNRVYHTMKDTVDQIHPEAVKVALLIAANAIIRLDQSIDSK